VTIARTNGLVRIVGSGLLGTSIGLALTKLGVSVSLSDASPATARLAADYGAGSLAEPGGVPDLVIVCVPPDVTAAVVSQELRNYPNALVTDVASVKGSIVQELKSIGADLSRYLGSHPMAGREKGGASSGRADIFVGRPWIIASHSQGSATALQAIEALALDLQAVPIQMSAEDHDRAVALVSHAPQLISSLMASQLVDADGVELAGQGLRDTVRIAASDPKLWVQIIGANAGDILKVLKPFQEELGKVIEALADVDQPGSLATIDRALTLGNRGIERLPGKHGSRSTQFATFVVMIEDQPGELARLLREVGEININVEDLKLEHSPGAPIGLVELQVLPARGETLQNELTKRGWKFA